VNTRYGFSVTLPGRWYGYKVVTSKWEGLIPNGNPERYEQGPIISIRHPLWTKQQPRQDIPVMIFTLAQWKHIEANDLSVSSAPIGPSELPRIAKYVFALPARYHDGLPRGYEEVNDLLEHQAVGAFGHAEPAIGHTPLLW